MNASIIIPLYNPDNEIINKIKKAIKNQKFDGKIEILFQKGKGLAENINDGINKAKHEIIVTLHQDCIPVGEKWLSKLVEPLKYREYVASVSDVELPFSLWNSFDPIAKILSSKEQRIITPLLDEKGCAYKKSALKKVGLFDKKKFRTAGEDFDLYIKLSKIGKLAHPHTKVIHYNYYSAKSRLKKEYQLANGFGALVRIYGGEMPSWYMGFIKATPVLGWILLFRGLNISKLRSLILIAPLALLLAHFQYIRGFWKGFLIGRQTV